MTGPIETEVKLRVPDAGAARDSLYRNGFTESAPRQFEANTVYDTKTLDLRKAGTLLRLREVGGKGVITWKGPNQPGPHKSRPEIETTLASASAMGQILAQLGYSPVFRYEKYRTEFSPRGPNGVATIDETPIGNFLELEGPGEWIDEAAKQLGFAPEDYILESYGRLYLADCERRGVQPGHMTFPSPHL